MDQLKQLMLSEETSALDEDGDEDSHRLSKVQ